MLFPVNRETRKLIAVTRNLLFLIAVNCAQDPPLRPFFFLALSTFIYLPQPPSFLTYFLRFIPSPPRFVIQLFLSIPDDRAIVGKRHGYSRIIPLACVGYEVVNSKRGAQRRFGYNYLISKKRESNIFLLIFFKLQMSGYYN